MSIELGLRWNSDWAEEEKKLYENAHREQKFQSGPGEYTLDPVSISHRLEDNPDLQTELGMWSSVIHRKHNIDLESALRFKYDSNTKYTPPAPKQHLITPKWQNLYTPPVPRQEFLRKSWVKHRGLPCERGREISIDRISSEYLHCDPQALRTIIEPWHRGGSDSRRVAKDSYISKYGPCVKLPRKFYGSHA